MGNSSSTDVINIAPCSRLEDILKQIERMESANRETRHSSTAFNEYLETWGAENILTVTLNDNVTARLSTPEKMFCVSITPDNEVFGHGYAENVAEEYFIGRTPSAPSNSLCVAYIDPEEKYVETLLETSASTEIPEVPLYLNVRRVGGKLEITKLLGPQTKIIFLTLRGRNDYHADIAENTTCIT
ncbi:Uncharacterised protein [uncultured archaeon]|nr:Uncharacterised protein [uncultured archaeon]